MAYSQSTPFPPPGPALDRLVADTVICTPMPYSTSDAAALTLLEEIDRAVIEKTIAGWTCTVFRLPHPMVRTSGISLAHAISLAAILVAQEESELGQSEIWTFGDNPQFNRPSRLFSTPLRSKHKPTLEELEELFWKRVDRRGPQECWPWLGVRNQSNYGTMKYAGKNLQATHVSFILFHKRPVLADVIAHSCDNPPCVNPFHLFEATFAENSQDMVRKGRHWRKKSEDHKSGFVSHGVLNVEFDLWQALREGIV